ncbi:hypothetical protein LXA43DRAFT_1097483 [Ganoderma leucocontextum]|nr:hypothetical protein LXA43DRAFT_1097483 [Ganoderma leucocontextum]
MSQPPSTTGPPQPTAQGGADAPVNADSQGLAASMHAPQPAPPPQQQQPPAPSNWGSTMDFDPFGGSGGGGTTGGFFNPFHSSLGSFSTTPVLPTTASPYPFPINTFPGAPMGQTVASAFMPQPMQMPPPPYAASPNQTDGWQIAYNVSKERANELAAHNTSLENENRALRQEVLDLGRKLRYHPYIGDTRPNRPRDHTPVNLLPQRTSSTPAHGMIPLPSTSSLTPRASACHTAPSNQIDTDRMDTDPPGGASRDSQASPSNEELKRTSERARPGRPDPSVKHDPQSEWYRWFRSAAATTGPSPTADWSREAYLPYIAIKSMGRDVERFEAERAAHARRDSRGPKARRDYQPPELGPWSEVKIVTALQAHNLRMRAMYDEDVCAMHLYHHLNSVHQDDLSLLRSEGVLYLIRSYSDNSHHMPFEHGSSNSQTRRQERKWNKAAPTPNAIPIDAPTPREKSTMNTSVPITPAPTPVARALATARAADLTSIHIILPAVIATEAWDIRASVRLKRELAPSMKSTDVVRTFTTTPTSSWPLGMGDDKDNFPPRGEGIYQNPLAADVHAEVFIASILPVVPDGQVERFAESAFLRGFIEVFSLPNIYPWVMEHGHYDQLLVDEPSPYPYDCTNLGIHHIVTWARSCGIDEDKDLRGWVHTYAINTRHRLEGRDRRAPSATFLALPSWTRDIVKDRYIRLIPSYDTLFDAPHCSYADVDALSRSPSGSNSSATTTTPPPEDVDMASNPTAA